MYWYVLWPLKICLLPRLEKGHYVNCSLLDYEGCVVHAVYPLLNKFTSKELFAFLYNLPSKDMYHRFLTAGYTSYENTSVDCYICYSWVSDGFYCWRFRIFSRNLSLDCLRLGLHLSGSLLAWHHEHSIWARLFFLNIHQMAHITRFTWSYSQNFPIASEAVLWLGHLLQLN